MKTSLIALAAFALFGMGSLAQAETVASTFDENCFVNYVGGGCGDRMVGSGANAKVAASKPEPEPEPKPCPKEPKGEI